MLTVCIISGAEASRIGRALASVAPWAKEIVVVINSGVNDGTAEIAMSHGAKVFFEPWKGFVGQKNSAAEKATQPWLLNLDADEEVPAALASEIQRAIAAPGDHAAFEFPRLTHYCGRWIRHGDWYPDRVLRLWRKGAARWAGEEPHAKLAVQGTIGRLSEDLLHFTSESIGHQIGKIVPYTENFVAKCVNSGKTPSLVHLAARPIWKFFRGYVLRLGFLDGWQGLYIAWVGAFSVATKYARVREALRK